MTAAARVRRTRLCSSCQTSVARRDGLCASCFNRRLLGDIKASERAQAEIAVADPRAARKGARAVAAAVKKNDVGIRQRAKKLRTLQLRRRRLLLEWHKRHPGGTYHEVSAPSGALADRVRRLDQQIEYLRPQRKRRGGGRPRDPRVDQRIAKAAKLIEKGLSLDRAAKQLDVDARELRRALNRRELPRLLAEWLAKMDQDWPPS